MDAVVKITSSKWRSFSICKFYSEKDLEIGWKANLELQCETKEKRKKKRERTAIRDGGSQVTFSIDP